MPAVFLGGCLPNIARVGTQQPIARTNSTLDAEHIPHRSMKHPCMNLMPVQELRRERNVGQYVSDLVPYRAKYTVR
jgi:hypothetical protein